MSLFKNLSIDRKHMENFWKVSAKTKKKSIDLNIKSKNYKNKTIRFCMKNRPSKIFSWRRMGKILTIN